MRTTVVAVAILSAFFMQEVSGGFLAATPKDTTGSANDAAKAAAQSVNALEEAETQAQALEAKAGAEDNEEDTEADEADDDEADEADEADDDEDEEASEADTKAAKNSAASVEAVVVAVEGHDVKPQSTATAVETHTETIEKTRVDPVKMAENHKASMDAPKAAQHEMGSGSEDSQPSAKLMESVEEDDADEADEADDTDEADEEDEYADDDSDEYADDDIDADNEEADDMDNDGDEEPAQADTKAAKAVQTPTENIAKTQINPVKAQSEMIEKASWDAVKAAEKEMMER